MDFSILKSLSQIAAPAGLAIGIFLYLARDIIAKNIFPVLTKEKAYRIILSLALMAWSIALVGIVAWAYVELNRQPKIQESTLPKHWLGSKVLNRKVSVSGIDCNTDELYIFPKRIYFPVKYDKEMGRYESIVEITKESSQTLVETMNWLTEFNNNVCEVIILSFIDAVSSSQYSLGLAQTFGNRVAQELRSLGLNPQKIINMSYGKEMANEVFVASETASKANFNTYVLIGVYLNN